ncbi:A-kinase anchor protein 9-like [Cynoglossus semilaevis]|uniref:A-kinase anchor protein 9-like n=1 Tax=Cynoglossus semilaevis TaxID=244447 RepID=UPI0004979D57|nr:A-kinase anchor protein 9-like [Cynoglossus semilaevis]
MRGHWVLCFLAAILSMGTMVVIVGQNQQLAKVQTLIQRKEQELSLLSDRVESHELLMSALGKQDAEMAKAVQSLEKEVSQVHSEDERNKKEVEECQAAQKTINDELAAKTKGNEDFNAQMQSESEAWKKEIASLEDTLKNHSQICSFVNDDPFVQKLCGIVVTTTTLGPTVTTTTMKTG